MNKLKYVWVFLCLVFTFPLLAQNDFIREDDVMFRTGMVRFIDLNWPKSKEVFGEDHAMPRILFDAVMEGKLKAYTDTYLEQELSMEELLEKLSECFEDTCMQVLSAESLTELELYEDLVFDSRHSGHYFISKSLALYLPESLNPRGLREPWAVFDFKEVSEVLKNDPRAYGQKKFSNGRKVNFADLFVMKTYYSETIRVGHDNELFFDQQYSDKVDAFIAAKSSEAELIEYLYKIYHPK